MSEHKEKHDDTHHETEGNFEMLKALYDFQAVYPKTISFDEGEYFILHQTSARQRNWWQVVSMKGSIGFVPSNYVMKLKVEPNFLHGFLESSIESLKLNTEKEINGIIGREELIEKLTEKKARLEKKLKKMAAAEEAHSHKHIGNGSVKTIDNHYDDSSSNPENDVVETKHRSKSHHHHHKHELNKKSMSSPAVGSAATPPQFVQESPSLNAISSELSSAPAQDNSVVSEASETTETITTTTTTTNTATTSDEITAISKTEEVIEPDPVCVENAECGEADSRSQEDIKEEEMVPEEIPENHAENDWDDEVKNEEPSAPIDIPNLHCSENAFEEPCPPKEPVEVIQVPILEEIKSESITTKVVKQVSDDTVQAIDAQDVYQIVDAIRSSTHLSHELSCAALRVVISELEAILAPSVAKHLEPIAVHLTAPLDVSDQFLGQTHDAQRLRIIFSDMADCKNDSQQRSWMLHEDEADIQKTLMEMAKILTDADPKICRTEMACDHYQAVVNLVLYYQMETRWSIRKLLLKAFKAMCHLDYTAVDILLGSVLPLELVQDMTTNPRHVEKLKELANMLIIIFSIGLKMPINHQDHLRSDFILFLLNIIESPPDTDVQEILPDIMISLILSFNLQFDNFAENVVLEAMEQRKTAKHFTEKILLLINREEDPVHTLKHTPPPVNPVLKMLVDLFSKPETASIFYTNDNKVLIDILVRQLSDLSAGEPIRKWYLELCRKILRNTNYPEHTHRKHDLMKIFTRIFCEETECSASDQQIVREIANEFPQIFKA